MALIIILNLKSSLRFQFKHLNQALKIILNLQICQHFHFKHLNGSWKFAITKLYFYINPIIPGVQKPYSARGGASEAPRVKSQHSGLPDDPMPYNGNYILCLGINQPLSVHIPCVWGMSDDRERGRDDDASRWVKND